MCPSNKMGFKAERAWEPAYRRVQSEEDGALDPNPKITSFKRLGWEGSSCGGHSGEGTNRDAMETKAGILRQKEEGAVLTAVESLGETGIPTNPEMLLWQDLGKEPVELYILACF